MQQSQAKKPNPPPHVVADSDNDDENNVDPNDDDDYDDDDENGDADDDEDADTNTSANGDENNNHTNITYGGLSLKEMLEQATLIANGATLPSSHLYQSMETTMSPAAPSTVSCNFNILPGLTADMFVLEVPSFVVPYIYEKPPAATTKPKNCRKSSRIREELQQSNDIMPTTTLSPRNFFDSTLGKLLMDIGQGLVEESVQIDLLRNEKRNLRKCTESEKLNVQHDIRQLQNNLDTTIKRNKPYKLKIKYCEFCGFKSESNLILANHYETPHTVGNNLKCNFCNYSVRSPIAITNHMLLVHKVGALLKKPPSNNQCPNCPYEDNGKARLLRHIPSCAKRFCADVNQAPAIDWEPPAQLPSTKSKQGLVSTAAAYQAMYAQAATQITDLVNMKRQQVEQLTTMSAQNALLRTKDTRHTSNIQKKTKGTYSPATFLPAKAQRKQPSEPPSVSIIPIPSPSTSAKATVTSTSTATNNFVTCEICFAALKTLEHLRKHMQRQHFVKIHPKCLKTQPPLSCLKCPLRFYSDHGLEIHLLCIHGLVTSSMQTAANNAKDMGRCAICRAKFKSFLLMHVRDDHGLVLRQAHLRYKCPLCTASFELHKEFDEHARAMHRHKRTGRTMNLRKSNANLQEENCFDLCQSSDNESLTSKDLLRNLERNDQITVIRKFGICDK